MKIFPVDCLQLNSFFVLELSFKLTVLSLVENTLERFLIFFFVNASSLNKDAVKSKMAIVEMITLNDRIMTAYEIVTTHVYVSAVIELNRTKNTHNNQ